MDVSFSNVLEGTRQYFQGLPKASCDDQPSYNHDTSTTPPLSSAHAHQTNNEADVKQCASPAAPRPPSAVAANSRPPSVAAAPSPARPPPAPSEPPEPPRPPSEGLLEPKPHFIHKATVMQQAQKKHQESYMNPIQDLERPPSIHLISPPTHIIPKPLHAFSSNSLDISKINRTTPQEDPRISPKFVENSQYRQAPTNTSCEPVVAKSPVIHTSLGAYKPSSHIPTPPQPSIHDMMNYQNRNQVNQQKSTPIAQVQQTRQSVTSSYQQHTYPRRMPNIDPRYIPSSPASHPQVSETYSQYSYSTAPNNQSTSAPLAQRIPSVSQSLNSHKTSLTVPSYRITTPTYSVQSNNSNFRRESLNIREHNLNHSTIQRQTHVAHQSNIIPQNSRVPPIIPHIIPSQIKPQYAPSKVPDQSVYSQQQQRNHYTYENVVQSDRKLENRDYTYSVHSNQQRTGASAIAHGSQQNTAASFSGVITDRYHNNASASYSSNNKAPVTSHQYLSSRATHSSAHPHEYHTTVKPSVLPAKSHNVQSSSTHPGYRYGSSVASTAPNNLAHGAGHANNLPVSNGTHYHQPPYQVTSVVKQTFETTHKHGQPSKTSLNRSNCPSQRMTVSVQSLVNQMNIMRKQQSSKQENVVSQKKESPLDLSVKTLKIPADSTRQDDTENVVSERREVIHRKHHILPLREPAIVSYANHTNSISGPTAVANTSHKVDFLPNFNSSYSETRHYETTNQPRLQSTYHPEYSHSVNTINRNNVVYPDNSLHGSNNYQSNVIKQNHSACKRIDHTLPRIDLTVSLGKDFNKEQVNGSQPPYAREDSRKRYANHPTNNIPEKIVRYETWTSNSRIEKLNNKDYNYIQQPAKVINGTSYDYNQCKLNETIKNENVSEYQMHSKANSYTQPHSNQYNVQYSSELYKYAPRENGSRYLSDRSYKNIGPKVPSVIENIDNLNSGSPADKRVLSILRNSLEVKSGIEQSRIIHNLDEPIVIDHDDPEPEIKNFAAVKENHVDKSHEYPVEPTQVQAEPISRKLHMPKAVDSIRYDSDSKSSYFDDLHNDNSKNSDDHSIVNPNSSKSASDIDVAARIRTKAELKGFTLPQEKTQDKDLNLEEKIGSLNNNNIPLPSIYFGSENVKRRLFSKDKNDVDKTDQNNVRKSNDTSVFDFEDSQPEDITQKKQEISNETLFNNVKIKEEPFNDPENDLNILNEVNMEVEDPFWTETCDNFLEQLKNGSVKKKVRKKKTDLEFTRTPEKNEEIKELIVDYKFEKSVVVNVIDIIKSEKSDVPYIMKIKEEVNEIENNIKIEPESSDDDEPLIKSKLKLNTAIPNSNKDLSCSNVFIKIEQCETPSKNENDLETDSKIHTNLKSKVKQKLLTNDADEKGSKKRRQDAEKRLNRSEFTSDDTDSDDNVTVSSRLRTRKCMQGSKSDESKTKISGKDSLKKKEDKNALKKPGFGDGSDFRPGWEEEVYRYKRSLRMPSQLINVPRSPHWPRISSSLPDLDPSSPAPSSSTTDDIFIRQKYSISGCDIADKCKDTDSDIESNFSFSVNQKVSYDSEASSSTVFSFVSKTARKKENGTSILDVLIQKCGKKDESTKKNKDEVLKPKLIPKSNNPLELLETPSLGIEKNPKAKGDTTPGKKEKLMEDLFYLGSFRKKTVSTFRNHFINNTDGLLGATEEFSPVVLKSRTRTESRVLKQRATIREVFGDERPASAPPSSCLNEEVSDSKCEEIKLKLPVKKIIKKFSIREGLRSSRILRRNDSKGRLLRHKKRNKLLKAFKSKKIKVCSNKTKLKQTDLNNLGKIRSTNEVEEPSTSSLHKKRFRKLFSRRKFSSGFDYIRKKKKIIKREDNMTKLPRRPVIKASPESVHDIQKEIKGWIINKGVGETALHRAARLGYTDCVAYCLEKLDLPPSAKDNAGFTALHEASSRGHLQIAKILLQYGANVSEAAKGGIRPLHEACENEHIEIIRLLLSYGADPLLATYGGQTPVSLAEGPAAMYLHLHIGDIQKTSIEPWHFEGPSKIFDLADSGCDVLSTPPPPSPSPPPPSPPIEISATHQPLPPLYTLKPAHGEIESTGPWCLLQDLSNLLQVKSRDSLLKQIHTGPGSPRDLLCELRTQDFLDRAICHQLMAAGEKINIRASKISLIKYTDRVKEMLDIETAVIR